MLMNDGSEDRKFVDFTYCERSFAECEKLLLSSDFYKLLGLVEIDGQASAGPLKAVRPFHRDGLREREQYIRRRKE